MSKLAVAVVLTAVVALANTDAKAAGTWCAFYDSSTYNCGFHSYQQCYAHDLRQWRLVPAQLFRTEQQRPPVEPGHAQLGLGRSRSGNPHGQARHGRTAIIARRANRPSLRSGVRSGKTGLDRVPQPLALFQGLLGVHCKSRPRAFHVTEQRPHPWVRLVRRHRMTFSSVNPAFERIQHRRPLTKLLADMSRKLARSPSVIRLDHANFDVPPSG